MRNGEPNPIRDGHGTPRRKFLKAGLAAAAGLGFARTITASGAGPWSSAATRTFSPLGSAIGLPEVDSIDIWCLEDNYTDAFLTSSETVIRPFSTLPLPANLYTERQFVTEHGFSALVTVHGNGQRGTLLYDGGLSRDGVSWNMEKLGLLTGDISAVVLSHGHIDHHNGLDKILQKVNHQGLPLIVHPDVWTERRLVTPTGQLFLPLPPPDRQHLEGGGLQIMERRQPSLLLNDMIAVTGEIPRETPYETGFPPHQKLTAAGWVPEPHIWDDQALVCNLKGQGLVVVTGCAHAGVINTLRYAQVLTGVTSIYAVIGGLHLTGPVFESRIAPTVADLVGFEPSIVVPAHCTGWKATHAIAAALPGAFIQNSVGTRYHFGT